MIGIEYINIPTKNCNSYSEETSLLVLSLLEQIKAKDAQLHSQDEQIAALETKLVHMSLELASAKASEDEHIMAQRRISESQQRLMSELSSDSLEQQELVGATTGCCNTKSKSSEQQRRVSSSRTSSRHRLSRSLSDIFSGGPKRRNDKASTSFTHNSSFLGGRSRKMSCELEKPLPEEEDDCPLDHTTASSDDGAMHVVESSCGDVIITVPKDDEDESKKNSKKDSRRISQDSAIDW